jgi:hypothetical protein
MRLLAPHNRRSRAHSPARTRATITPFEHDRHRPGTAHLRVATRPRMPTARSGIARRLISGTFDRSESGLFVDMGDRTRGSILVGCARHSRGSAHFWEPDSTGPPERRRWLIATSAQSRRKSRVFAAQNSISSIHGAWPARSTISRMAFGSWAANVSASRLPPLLSSSPHNRSTGMCKR